MKKIIILTASLFCILASCSKADLKTKDNIGDCLVTINPIGEISTSDNPLTKLGNNNGLYLIQVYQNDTTYAVGLSQNLTNFKIYLHKGIRYKFIVSAIGISTYSLSSTNSSYSLFYTKGSIYAYNENYNAAYTQYTYFPAKLSNWNSPSSYEWPYAGVFYSYRPYYLTNSSNSNGIYSYYYFKRPELSNIGVALINGDVNPTNTNDWFYGEATFTPAGTLETLDMIFKRVGYKLKYELNGVTDGEVTVTIKTQSGKVLIQNTTNTETYSGNAIFVPYYNIASVYQNPNNYYENLIVSVSWLRGIGVTQDLGSTTIQVKRNNLNRVRISLGNSDAGAAMNLSTEAESMGTESTDITVE